MLRLMPLVAFALQLHAAHPGVEVNQQLPAQKQLIRPGRGHVMHDGVTCALSGTWVDESGNVATMTQTGVGGCPPRV